MKVNLQKKQNTNNKSITCYFYNKSDSNYNNLQFLIDKINQLLKSDKTTDSVKKLLNRLQYANFEKYDLFFVYSNVLYFGIDKANKTIDFYRDCDYMIDKDFLSKLQKNYNCKINIPKSEKQKAKNQLIDSNDLQ